jgi:hypothetical protein
MEDKHRVFFNELTTNAQRFLIVALRFSQLLSISFDYSQTV